MKSITELMGGFRVAMRELFNNHFRVSDPWSCQEEAWRLHSGFRDLEAIAFEKLVADRLSANTAPYGSLQPGIIVIPKVGDDISALINRDVDSGYWDFPVATIPGGAVMHFIEFFDWDSLGVRDNKYVRVRIASCPANVAIEGRDALIDAQDVSFILRNDK